MERINRMANLILLLVSVFLGATGQFLFRLGMRSYGKVSAAGVFKNIISIILSPPIFIGFLLFGVSSILWLSVISKNQLSYAYPMVSLGYILTLVLSRIFLSEELSFYRILGTVFIISGVVFISKT
jgi:uncharacterized membrane protein